jgi:muramoyltetrapeptide carboxypeptidase LdcA involved in peptidoglycan recycling
VEAAIRDVVGGEFGRPSLLVVGNLPFGHTDPQWVLPMGVRASIDPARSVLRLEEPWLA